MISPTRNFHSAQFASNALIFGVALLLTGCASDEDTSRSWTIVRTVGSAWDAFGNSSITLDQVKAIPYASIGYRVGESPEEMIVLAAEEDGTTIWTSSAKITLVMRDGKIVRSIGLQHDLNRLTPQSGSNNARLPLTGGNGETYTNWQAQFDDIGDAPVTCTTRIVSPENIEILGKSVHTERLDESCSCPRLRWAFHNVYWTDPADATVLRSIQYVHPKLQPVTVEILRPRSRA